MIKSHALWMEKGMQQQGGGKAGRTSWPHSVDYHVQIQLPDAVAQASSIVRPACATEVCPYHSLRTTMLLILLLTSVLVPGPGPVLSYPVLSYPVLSCPVLSCPVLPCKGLSCPVPSSKYLRNIFQTSSKQPRSLFLLFPIHSSNIYNMSSNTPPILILF